MGRANKYQHLADPQATLDFHGKGVLTQRQIKDIVDRFIADCRASGFHRLLIVTGKGMHSAGGVAVVKPVVEGYLRSRDDVKSAVPAPVNRGGDGAVMVVLEQKE